MKKLAVCEGCGNIFMMGDRVWKYRGDKLCSEECARKAEFLGKQGKWKNDIDKKEKENKKMKEIKLTIDGKEVRLTDEQAKALKLELLLKMKSSNPFERVEKYAEYYCIKGTGEIYDYCEDGGSFDSTLYSESNYFNDKNFANQVALHQLLYRKLLKYAYDNGFEDTKKWELYNRHWRIYYDHIDNDFAIIEDTSAQNQCVYFSTGVGAKRAIEEVVKPFMKEHPDFVW